MEISIIEFLVYAVIGYSPLIVLYVSLVKDVPNTKANTIFRVVLIVPGLIAVGILSGSGLDINLETSTTISNITTTSNATSEVWTELGNVTKSDSYTLQNPIWILFHSFLFTLYSFYIIIQIMQLLIFKN